MHFRKAHPEHPVKAHLIHDMQHQKMKYVFNYCVNQFCYKNLIFWSFRLAGIPLKPLTAFKSFFKKLRSDGTLKISDKKKAAALWKALGDDEKLEYEREYEKVNAETCSIQNLRFNTFLYSILLYISWTLNTNPNLKLTACLLGRKSKPLLKNPQSLLRSKPLNGQLLKPIQPPRMKSKCSNP